MRKVVGRLLLFALIFASQTLTAPVANAGGLWGGIWHRTSADGSQVDCLDAGPNDSVASLAGLTFTVTGPGGFIPYTFSGADLYSDVYGNPEVYHEFSSPLPPGLYTFTLDDGAGQVSRVTDTHVTAPPLQRVGSDTIQYQRDASGYYRFSWAPLNDTRTYFYRLSVVLDTPEEPAVFWGSRSMVSSDFASWRDENGVLRPTPLQDGVAYKARVEVHDAASFEAVTNRSYSDWVKFTPKPSDYTDNASRQNISDVAIYNRHESAGSLATDLSLVLHPATGVTRAYVTGPDFSYDYDLVNDLDTTDASWPELYLKKTPALAPGLYTFHVLANGQPEQKGYANLSAPVGYPAPDVSTYQAEDQGDGTIRFSWAGVDHSGALYYRVYLQDPATGRYVISQRSNETYADLPASGLAGLANTQWRVEVCDSPSFTTQRNRVVGPYKTLAVRAYDAQNPNLSANISHATNYNGNGISDIWMNAWGSSLAPPKMDLLGPGGYSRDISSPLGSTDFLEPVTAAPGLYSFSATDPGGKSTTRYHYLPAAHHIDPVDFRTVNVNRESYGYLTLSWAPVVSDIPLWYGVEFYYAADQNADGQMDAAPLNVGYYLTGTSLWIPESEIPTAPFMFRVYALDGSDGSSYNNYSRSVMVGYSGPGYNYAALTDDDGDGYASNVDTDNANASVNPFPYPQITAFSIPATSASLTVPITTITANLSKAAGGCLTETNNSATCNWVTVKPVSYSFATPGAHTLYAFIKDASGNISASASAQTSITLPNSLLNLAFVGSGAGQVNGGMTCTKGASCPPASFATGAQVILNPAPGFDSLFSGWSGDCVISGDSCIVALNAAKSVSAGFDIMPAVWLSPGSAPANYFGLLADAFQIAGAGATIKAKVNTFTENLVLNRGIGIKLKGGFSAGYQSNLGNRSILHGTLKVCSGSLVAEGLAIR
jgi:hypothetical protein